MLSASSEVPEELLLEMYPKDFFRTIISFPFADLLGLGKAMVLGCDVFPFLFSTDSSDFVEGGRAKVALAELTFVVVLFLASPCAVAYPRPLVSSDYTGRRVVHSEAGLAYVVVLFVFMISVAAVEPSNLNRKAESSEKTSNLRP